MSEGEKKPISFSFQLYTQIYKAINERDDLFIHSFMKILA